MLFMSDIIFLALEPLRQVSADLTKSERNSGSYQTHGCRIIVAFFMATNSANRLWYL